MYRKLRTVFGGKLLLFLSVFAAVRAQVVTDTFSNPVAPMGHDPWVIQHEGVYFYCYSDQNKLWVNSSADLTQAVQFEGKAVWTPPGNTPYSKQLWAPELHFLDGSWYIYVAASNGENENHRMYVLRSETPDGSFEMMGKIATPEDKWAIDGTVLELGEQRFFIWSGWEGDVNVAQHLYIAEMDSPLSLKGERVRISSPEYDWERRRGKGPKSQTMPFINEGPEVLQHAGDTFLVYSASGSWSDDYCLGMLRLTGSNPMKASSWTKKPEAVFTSAGEVYAPGHACFTQSPDGQEDWIVYHTAQYSGAGWKRETRMQPFRWSETGEPDFGIPLPSGTILSKPSGTPR